MKKYNPTSPARRHIEAPELKGVLTRPGPEKSLTRGFYRAFGRNSKGRITTRHKGAGAKRLWREIDFKYDKKDVPAEVRSIEYDPNRSALIALLVYRDGEKRYVLAPNDLKLGSKVVVSQNAPIQVGNRTLLERIPVGTSIFNVEIEPGRGSQLVRSAGVMALVLAQKGLFTHLELPSKEIRMIPSRSWASIGSLSNPEHMFRVVGKAGRSRKLGIRPTVRGSAMNPVDHPHGGGEGRTLIGRRRGPATPWGKPARGVKTRKNKRSDRYIISRRKK